MSVNPFRELRDRAGISQYELARRMGISKHAILRLEQGMYEDPLPTAVAYWVNTPHAPSRAELLTQYQQFQIETRESNARLFGDLTLGDCPVGTHPLTYLREKVELNLTVVAKMLCLSQSTLFYFERNPVTQGIVPVQLIEALHDADYSSLETQSLENAYAIHRDHLIKNQHVTSSTTPSTVPEQRSPTNGPVGKPKVSNGSE